MVYLFPFEKVERGAKVILYGAGESGYEFYQQIMTTGYCEVIAWVDRQYQWYRFLGLPVIPPDRADWNSAESVIVAVTDPGVFEQIQRSIVKRAVPEHKIIWRNYELKHIPPVRLEGKQRAIEAEKAVQCSPKNFLTDRRLDLAIRCAYAKELLGKTHTKEAERLYEKLIETTSEGAEEPVWNRTFCFFSDYEQKRGMRAFKTAFLELLHSMKKNGFLKNYFIPLDKNGEPVNGAHRIAAALALEIPVWVVDFPLFEGFHFDFTAERLEKEGFSLEEMRWIKMQYKNIWKDKRKERWRK